MQAPLISIIVPYYNSEAYFRDLLESINSQTIKDFEIIIVDDKSRPESRIYLDKLIKSYPQLSIQITTNTINMGIAKSRNAGLRLSKGKYITIIDADDILCGRYSLEYRINFLEQNYKFAGVGGYDLKIDQNGKALFQPFDKKEEYFRAGVAAPENLRKIYAKNVIKNTGSKDSASTLFFLAGSCSFRREDVIDFLFDPYYELEDDVEWLVRFLGQKLIKLELLPFHCRRVHEAQHHLQTPSKITEEVLKLCRKIVDESA